MSFFYAVGVRIYAVGVRLVAVWNNKAKKRVQGAAHTLHILKQWQRGEGSVYWFHCASLGEFEQGRPLIEALKARENCQIVLTFFSPSGYEIRKNYPLADLVCYLPTDTKANANQFLTTIKPTAAFFIKYEFWANYLLIAEKHDIPTFSVAAVFRQEQLFFKWYGGYMRKVLKSFTAIFVQDNSSQAQLQTIGVSSLVSGDTRYDRVMQNAEKVQPYPVIETFIGEAPVFVVGSSWKADEELIANALVTKPFEGKLIIAPHEIGEHRIRAIEERFENTVRYSRMNEQNSKAATVLIIDNIGMLMNVYQYATMAYVGGGFGTGLHNILEPACFGIPVIFGPDYGKFQEATDFIEAGIGKSVSNAEALLEVLPNMTTVKRGKEVKAFMNARTGATHFILSEIKKWLPQH